MSERTFDTALPVQTRDGRKARIICTDAKQGPGTIIVGLVEQKNGGEFVSHYRSDGIWSQLPNTAHNDLINIPETHEVLVYYGKNSMGLLSISRSDDTFQGPAIASKRITFTEGEFED